MTTALDGLRVVDLSHYLAGPLVAAVLGGCGADVIRIDPPSGPRWNHPANAMLQRDKRSIALDLRAPSDLDIARRLVARADVVIENFRPGVAERLGVGPVASVAANPSLVYCSIPGFAASDPRAGVAAWEGVVCAAGGIYVPRSADPDDDPSFNAIPYASSFGAVVAAHSVLAALIVRDRTGWGQYVESPLFDALFEAIGHFGLRVDGGPAPRTPAEFAAHGGAAPHGGFYRCADGRWIHLCLIQHRHLAQFAERFFPADWVADGMADGARMGGVDTDSDLRSSDPGLAARARRRFAELFATRPAAEWERLINDEIGCPTAACLTTAEWLDDEHARVVDAVLELDDPQLGRVAQAGHPIVLAGTPARPPRPRRALDADRAEVLAELGTVPPRPVPAGRPDRNAPLRGLRVVDCSQVLAGPTSSRILAEYGADVVKVMSPYDGQIMAHAYTNSGKRSIMLDLRTDEGRRIYLSLTAGADVVVENFSLGTTDRMGIGEHTVRATNPDVVYASVSSYGWWDGPRSAWRGREELGQAVTGMEMRRGGPAAPRMQPFALNDYGAGNWAAVAILLGLHHRLRGGRGQHVHTSLAHAATFHQVPDMLAGPGVDVPSRAGTFGPSATDRLYRARDRWLYLAAPHLAEDDVLAVLGAGGDLAATIAARSARDVVDRLRADGIAAEPLATVEEVMEDGRTRARGLSLRTELPGAGRCRVLGPSPRLSRTPPRPTAASRAPGADGRSVLALVDLDSSFDHLVATGVVHAALAPGVALVGRVRAAI